MIIIGYPAIGKSSLAREDINCIDLESSCFMIEGKRYEGWEIVYVQIAEHLSKQGYIVFVSSHKAVQEALKRSSEKVYACFPSLEIKDKWLHRLEDRYNQTKSDKDFRAWSNAVHTYDESILTLMRSGFNAVIITDVDYDIKQCIALL